MLKCICRQFLYQLVSSDECIFGNFFMFDLNHLLDSKRENVANINFSLVKNSNDDFHGINILN